MSADIDPLTLGSIWRSLSAIANDAGRTLQRTAFSEAVREGRDFSVALFDRRARLIAQGDYSPGHLGSMPGLVGHVLESYPADGLSPGDAIVLNDPWLGSGHLPDFLLTSPIFASGELVGYVASCVHMIDVGGAVPGSQAVAGIDDVHQEGLRLPATRIWHQGRRDDALIRLIAANVRVPDKLVGDLQAMRSCNHVADRELGALLDRVGGGAYGKACDAILARSEEAMRESLAAIPDGRYEAVDHLDDCGPGTDPIRIQVAVTVEGDELTLDFEGSDPQTRSGINSVANYTRAYCYFAIKAVTHGASLPQNAGSINPIHWMAPAGSVVNAVPPAGVGARAIMQQRIVDVIMQALAHLLPEKVVAPSSHWTNPVVGGLDPSDGTPFVFYDIIVGGFGGRHGRDGVEAMCPSFNIDGIPTEVNEQAYPLIVERYELIRDSAGPGRWRGGHGVRKDVRLLGHEMKLSNLAERHRFQPPGLLGGHPGPTGETIVNPDGEATVVPAKATARLSPGDVVSQRLSGGGGFGDPLERDVHAVAADVRSGLTSPGHALAAYGVVLAADGSPDPTATERHRERLRTARPEALA